MIQRIQSIYLLIASVLATIFSFINDYTFSYLKDDNFLLISSSLAILISAGVALSTIFLYKNRTLQIRLIWFSLLIALAGLGLYVYLDGISNFFLDWQFYFIPIILVFLFLAKRGVQKDEELIKSSYRLR